MTDLSYWMDQIKKAELLDAQHGFVIPGDSCLAVVLNSMEEEAYAEDDKKQGGRERDITPILTAWMNSWPKPRPIWPWKVGSDD